MRKFAIQAALVALLAGVTSFSTPSRAETGQVAVVFTKGGFIIGVGGGQDESRPLVPGRTDGAEQENAAIALVLWLAWP